MKIGPALFLCVISAAGVVPARAQTGSPAPVPVMTMPVEARQIAGTASFVGRVEAIDRVEVRARVKGFLEGVEFTEGMTVSQGAALYRIEKDLFEADVQAAQGALEKSTAAHQLAEIQLGRAQELLDRNAGTVVARDQARAQEQAARGAMLADAAALQTARINLGYTKITSPVAGRIGRTAVTRGNVVGPDSGPLTVIVSQDPMYVTFPVSQRDLMQARGSDKPVDPKSIKVRLLFSDGGTYDQVGQIDFVDVSVNRTTDTVSARATMPNPAGRLIDGQFVRVQLESGAPQERLVLPQSALIADQGGVYVFVVQDEKAVTRRVKVGGEVGMDVIVEQGLAPGEQVIVEGLQGVRPGVPVRAAPAPRPLRGS